jgi:hypothetical protein
MPMPYRLMPRKTFTNQHCLIAILGAAAAIALASLVHSRAVGQGSESPAEAR